MNKITDIFVDKLPSFATIKKQKGILTKERDYKTTHQLDGGNHLEQETDKINAK